MISSDLIVLVQNYAFDIQNPGPTYLGTLKKFELEKNIYLFITLCFQIA